ncbi:hypothetical protein K8R32_03515 [bacterium]|nr:hypothetical protein [bacterium]
MHIYIYDSYVNQKRYDSIIAKIETRITDLGLNGKIIRLGVMNSPYNAVENELKKGAKTIIAVGNNNIYNQLINVLAKMSATDSYQCKTPLGFIPVGKKNNEIADYLGVGLEEEACDILSARRTQELDLGMANDQYFLTTAIIPTLGTTVEIDKNYSIEITKKGEIQVINLPIMVNMPSTINTSAKDGVLEMLIKTKPLAKGLINKSLNSLTESVFSFKKLFILNKNLPIILDSVLEVPAPATITIAKEKINLIVGKNRRFS